MNSRISAIETFFLSIDCCGKRNITRIFVGIIKDTSSSGRGNTNSDFIPTWSVTTDHQIRECFTRWPATKTVNRYTVSGRNTIPILRTLKVHRIRIHRFHSVRFDGREFSFVSQWFAMGSIHYFKFVLSSLLSDCFYLCYSSHSIVELIIW